MGRNPVDPLAIDGVEVSRGPNANVFGLGSPAGTVNQVPSSANTSRDRSQVIFRGDSYDGYRSSLDVNRVLVKGKLAIRASGHSSHDGYIRKPSGTNIVRYNGMIKFQPFKNTTITGSYGFYRMNGNRPNAAPPRDQISYWIASGETDVGPGAATGPSQRKHSRHVYFCHRAARLFPQHVYGKHARADFCQQRRWDLLDDADRQ